MFRRVGVNSIVLLYCSFAAPNVPGPWKAASDLAEFVETTARVSLLRSDRSLWRTGRLPLRFGPVNFFRHEDHHGAGSRH